MKTANKFAINHKTLYRAGFTVVELLIAIVAIGILAAIVIVSYGNFQNDAKEASIASDLTQASSYFDLMHAREGSYPEVMTEETVVSAGNILSTTYTGDADEYCISAYREDGTIERHWSSQSPGVKDGLCPGFAVVDPIDGDTPPGGHDGSISPDFDKWAFFDGATLTDGVVDFTSYGWARSPYIQVDQPNIIDVDGEFFADQESVSSESKHVGYGAYSLNIRYLDEDKKSVENSIGYTSNGCAASFAMGVWTKGRQVCRFSGGKNVHYVQLRYYGSSYGYASPDLKMRLSEVTLQGDAS